MTNVFEGKTILVTGGCGSVGTEIVTQLLNYKPKVIRVLDHDEAGHFKLNQKIKSGRIRNLIGDIRDRERLIRAMEDVDIIFHAAALKHVPFCEYNPFEAVNTNVVGTKNLIDAAIEKNVEKMISISTDKAVNPVNTMGATKLLAEKIVTNAPMGKRKSKFCCVRFGNVLDSVGSVIPIFRKQIEEGGPITITSKEMTRFFMSLPDAVHLILKAAESVHGGEIFILKMDALRIVDLAEVMVEELAQKYGYDPKKIKYEYIGVRPGEKIHEALMSREEAGYMVETADMIILRNSLLAVHSYGKMKVNNKTMHEDYESNKVKLLNKKEVKEVLYKNNIL